MISSKMKIMALTLAAAFTFTGCGEALYELTPEEESAVVSYASHVVAKYNLFQRDGEVFVSQEVLDGVDEEETEQPSDTQQEMTDTQQEAEDTQQSDEQGASQNAAGEENAVSIKEALGLEGIAAQYGGSSLCEVYEKSDSFAVDAEPGRQLLVLSVKLTNETGEDIQLDILKKKPAFDAVVNGEKGVRAQMTILPNDLATYQGGISSGESVESVLIFQIPKEIESVSDLELGITIDGSRYKAKL